MTMTMTIRQVKSLIQCIVCLLEIITLHTYNILFNSGTADWHFFRKFSLTSSQAHKAFLEAFVLFKDNTSWIAVANYLYGKKWIEVLKINDEEEVAESNELDVDETGQNNEDEVDPTPTPIHSFIENYIVQEEDDQGLHGVLCKLKAFVIPERNEGQEEEEEEVGISSVLLGRILADEDLAQQELKGCTSCQS